MTDGLNIVSTGQTRAQSISIQVSSRTRCSGNCKFCISRTTPGNLDPEDVTRCEFKRLRVGLRYAERLGATHAILTGKADPTQEDSEYLRRLVVAASKHLPLVDMHTNGIVLQAQDNTLLENLVVAGLTMVTFSIASFDPEKNFYLMGVKQDPALLIAKARKCGLLVRCSLVVNKKGACDINSIMEYVRAAGNLGAHQVVIREVWIPDALSEEGNDVRGWNEENKIKIAQFQNEFGQIAEDPGNKYGLQLRDPLPWGTPVFVVGGQKMFDDPDHGVNVTFARCDDSNSGAVIKSIVHKPNGHGYRNWDHNGDNLY